MNQWTRNDLAVQQWQFVDAGGGFYRVRSRHSGKVLELPNALDGTAVVQYTDDQRPPQQFRLSDSAGGYVRFVNRQSGQGHRRVGAVHRRRGRLAAYQDLDGANQQWQLVRLGGGTPTSPAPTTPAPGLSAARPGHRRHRRARPDGGKTAGRQATWWRTPATTSRSRPPPTGSRSATRARSSPAARRGPPRTPGAARNLWAPDLSYRNGRTTCTTRPRRSAPTGRRSSWPPAPPAPSGSWTNQGLVIESTDHRTTSTPSTRTWSSTTRAAGGSPSARSGPASRWSRSTRRPGNGSDTHRCAASPAATAGAIEAPVIVQHGAYYYL